MIEEKVILEMMAEAEAKAWEALGGYKFWMFGYWAVWWVKLNQMGGFKQSNPFKILVKMARGKTTIEKPKNIISFFDEISNVDEN